MPLLKFIGDRLSPALEEPLQEVTLDEWRVNPLSHAGATALSITNDAALDHVSNDLSGFDVIILTFPTFKDGRAYSQARLLRERYGYTGEIRARGDVLYDQLQIMVRCGFNAFEFTGERTENVHKALIEFSHAYQTAADSVDPIWRRRLSRAEAA